NAKGKQEHPDRLVKSENIVEEVVQCPQERFQRPHPVLWLAWCYCYTCFLSDTQQ
ncbi:hypothetical protein JOQ06_004494, partial [Pogonophryne albipinna]